MRGSTLGTILYLLNGPILWAVHFTAIYGAQSTMCGRDLPAPVQTVVLGTTIAALIPLAAITAWPAWASRLLRKRNAEIPHALVAIARWLSLLSAIAILWAGATALWIPPCPPLR